MNNLHRYFWNAKSSLKKSFNLLRRKLNQNEFFATIINIINNFIYNIFIMRFNMLFDKAIYLSILKIKKFIKIYNKCLY